MTEGGHRRSVDVPDEALDVDADQVRMAQVLSNLVGNAAKYTEPGGSIRVQVTRVPAGPGAGHPVELRVTDSGVGISAGDLHRIFDMFQQVGQRSGHIRTGLGVGLTLARSIVEMHGGTPEARSEGLGHGSTFTVRLPLVDPTEGRGAEDSGAERVQAIPKRVLVVDDYQDATVSPARLLETDGHETRVALSGRQALQVADELLPEVILLDIGLPDLDGYEVCRRLRERPRGRDVLMVALPGWGQDEDKGRARSAGFDAHRTKPADRAQLHALLGGQDR